MARRSGALLLLTLIGLGNLGGCATNKESHTPRTGVEQLLISSAVEESLDRVDMTPLVSKKVFFETKYLDCIDKNYIILSVRGRILKQGAILVDKLEEADTVVEVAAGSVGTDGQELFVGVPEIPLPPPSPISIPKLSIMTRSRMTGTAKLLVVAYDAKTRQPLLESANTLARSDHNNWNFLGAGPVQTGSVPRQIAAATKAIDFNLANVAYLMFPEEGEPAITPASMMPTSIMPTNFFGSVEPGEQPPQETVVPNQMRSKRRPSPDGVGR